MAEVLTPMRRQILEFIITCQRERNFPPTIREIGDHVGLKSPATVANHIEVLKNAGFIEKNPQQPRTLTVRLDAENPVPDQHIRHIPFVGDVAAGTGVAECVAAGEIVVAGINDGEATVKRYFPQGSRIVLKPENSQLEPMEFGANDVTIYGRVISVLRSY